LSVSQTNLCDRLSVDWGDFGSKQVLDFLAVLVTINANSSISLEIDIALTTIHKFVTHHHNHRIEARRIRQASFGFSFFQGIWGVSELVNYRTKNGEVRNFKNLSLLLDDVKQVLGETTPHHLEQTTRFAPLSFCWVFSFSRVFNKRHIELVWIQHLGLLQAQIEKLKLRNDVTFHK